MAGPCVLAGKAVLIKKGLSTGIHVSELWNDQRVIFSYFKFLRIGERHYLR